VCGLHTRDHSDHSRSAAGGIIVVREQQVMMTGRTKKLLRRCGLGRLVEELRAGLDLQLRR